MSTCDSLLTSPVSGIRKLVPSMDIRQSLSILFIFNLQNRSVVLEADAAGV